MTISIEHTGFTDLGTGTAKTQLGGASVTLPTWSNSLLAMVPMQSIGVPTAAQSVWTLFSLESADAGEIVPYEVLGTPIGSILGATSSSLIAKPEKWQVGLQYTGGDRIDVYGTPKVANTGAGLTGGCSLVVADQTAGHNLRHAKLGTVTSTGTTATADVAGTAYTVTSGTRLVELYGCVSLTTITAGDDVIAYIKYVSSDFVPSVTPKLPINPITGGLSTLVQNYVDGVSRMPVSIGMRSPTTIADYLYMGTVPGTAGKFVSGIVYE